MATFGETSILGTDAPESGYAMAQKHTLSEAGEVTSVSVYLSAVGDNVRLAIYDHDPVADEPENLLAETVSQAGVAGWTTVPLSVALEAGTYWLARQVDGNTSLVYWEASGWRAKLTRAYGAFPDPWGVSQRLSGFHYSLYATYTLKAGGYAAIF